MYRHVPFDISVSVIGFKYVPRISLCIGYFIRFSLNLLLKLWLMRTKFMNLCTVWLLLLSRLGKASLLSDINNSWWEKCAHNVIHTELIFRPFSKTVKAVSCITDLGVSTAIITFFVSAAGWTLDSSLEAANFNTKLYFVIFYFANCNTKVYFSSCLAFFSITILHWLNKKNFLFRNLNHPNLLFLSCASTIFMPLIYILTNT